MGHKVTRGGTAVGIECGVAQDGAQLRVATQGHALEVAVDEHAVLVVAVELGGVDAIVRCLQAEVDVAYLAHDRVVGGTAHAVEAIAVGTLGAVAGHVANAQGARVENCRATAVLVHCVGHAGIAHDVGQGRGAHTARDGRAAVDDKEVHLLAAVAVAHGCTRLLGVGVATVGLRVECDAVGQNLGVARNHVVGGYGHAVESPAGIHGHGIARVKAADERGRGAVAVYHIGAVGYLHVAGRAGLAGHHHLEGTSGLEGVDSHCGHLVASAFGVGRSPVAVVVDDYHVGVAGSSLVGIGVDTAQLGCGAVGAGNGAAEVEGVDVDLSLRVDDDLLIIGGVVTGAVYHAVDHGRAHG